MPKVPKQAIKKAFNATHKNTTLSPSGVTGVG
mgnify:CR=1 FL=1